MRAHQRLERLGRRAGRLEEQRRGALERDDVVRREHRAGVVERARGVGELERPQAEHLGEPHSLREGVLAVSAVTAAQAPSSCSGPRARVNVCSGWTLKRRSCGASAASGVAPLTCATHGPGAIAAATSAIAASGTQSRHELRLVCAHADAPLAQPSGDSRADTARPDDVDAVHFGGSSSVADAGQVQV